MGAKTSVLYFDDSQLLLRLFREMFGDDFDVRTAATLSDARRELSRLPNVVISDLNILEVSGIDFLRLAEKVCPDCYRVLLTGQGTVGNMLREISTGLVQVFITKPWTEAEMREALERAAAPRRSLRPRP